MERITSINAETLQQRITTENILLIDVREPWEHEAFNIGGKLIPLSSIFVDISLIPKHCPVVFYCQKGIRSAIAIQRLQQKYNYTDLINLTGGIDAWKRYFHL